MKKVFIDTYGCAKNEYDSQALAASLEERGCVIVYDTREADILIINTCGFIEDAKRESIEGILSLTGQTDGGRKKLIVTGCLSERYHKELADEMPEVDMFFGARPSASQMQEAEERGIELQITPIGREAFVFFVEEDNPVDGLTSDQLKAIYHGDITNWGEVGGKNQEILAFQRPHNSGSQTMMEYFMGDVTLKEPQTYETVDAMTGVIRQVAQYANEKGAMGYSFRYFLEGLNQEKGVKMLSVDGVYPSLENIENGSYPLVTNVCLITRKDDPNPYVQKMIDYILSEQGQYIVRETGYAGVANG